MLGLSSKPDVDVVNKPPWYCESKVEVYDAIVGMGLDYTEGQVVKYISRWRKKNGLEDLKKAQWYLSKLIDEAVELKVDQDNGSADGDSDVDV